MSETRKTSIPKNGAPLPPLSRLKRLSKEHRDTIMMWLEDKPQTEVAKLVERNFDISCSSQEVWESTLSRFRTYVLRLPELEARNALAEYIQDRLENSTEMPPAQVREFVLETLAVIGDKAQAPEILLPLAKELRQGEELKLERHKVHRETARLFLKWFEDKKAREIAEGSGSRQEKIESLGRAMFPDWEED